MPRAKPHSPRLDRSHPDAAGLLGAWLPTPSGFADGSPVRDLSGRHRHCTLQGSMTADDWVASPYGWALDMNGGSPGNRFETKQDQWTDADVASGSVSIIYKSADSTAAQYLFNMEGWVGISIAAADTTQFQAFSDGSGSAKVTTTGTPLDGKWHILDLTWDASTIAIYVDGKQVDSGASGGVPQVELSGNRETAFATNYNGTNGLACTIASGIMWGRVRPASEIARMYADPFAMFRPRRRVFKAPAAVAGGIVVLRRRIEAA